MPPVAPPDVAGRALDYLPGYNLATRPRAYELVDFATLRMLGDSYDLLRLVIETRKDQLVKLPWDIRVSGGVKSGVKVSSAVQSRIDDIKRFFKCPDGEHTFRAWFRSLLEDVFVVDAASLYCQRDRGGNLLELQQVDGATIKRVIDYWGRSPRPFKWDGNAFVWNQIEVTPDRYQMLGFKLINGMMYPPAYQEVLKGLPAIDYTSWDLIYRPYNLRPGRVYGMSPVEQVIVTVNIALRRQTFQLEYYREGSVPDSIIGTPDTWTPDQISDFQNRWDMMLSGNLGQRRKAKFIPGGVAKNYIATKEPALKGPFDEWLARVVFFAFSVAPTALMQQTNRATAQTSKETSEEEGLEPMKAWSKELFDDIIEKEYDSPDLEFAWIEETEVDQTKQEAILTGYLNVGSITINELRADLGKDPSDNPAADLLMVQTATGFVPIEANTPEAKAADAEAQAKLSAKYPPPAPPQFQGQQCQQGKNPGGDPGGDQRGDQRGGDRGKNTESKRTKGVGKRSRVTFQNTGTCECKSCRGEACKTRRSYFVGGMRKERCQPVESLAQCR